MVFRAPQCEVAHLLGHDGKPFARIARPGRLHSRIERKQIGLEGNFVDGFYYLCRFIRRVFDLLVCLSHFLCSFAALPGSNLHFIGHPVGFATMLSVYIDTLRGLFGIAGVLMSHGGHLFEAAGYFFEVGGLFAGALRHGLTGLGNLGGSGGDLLATLRNAQGDIPKFPTRFSEFENAKCFQTLEYLFERSSDGSSDQERCGQDDEQPQKPDGENHRPKRVDRCEGLVFIDLRN